MRKKLNAAAGLVSIAAAGALIASTPALAEQNVASATASVTAPGSAAHRIGLVVGARALPRQDDWWDHHHRRHYRHYRHYHRYHHGPYYHRHHHRYRHHRFHDFD